MALFPTYLVQRGHLRPSDMVDAVLQQRAARPRLGELAVNRGKLSRHDLTRLIERHARSHARLGEVAVEVGVLTETEVEELLAEQEALEPDLMDVLLERGAVTQATLDSQEEQFRRLSQPPSNAHQAKRAAHSLACAIASLAQLKPFSTAVREALDLAGQGASPAALAAALEKDPAMAAATLRLANSAMYRRGTPCATLEEATARLGVRNVQNLVLGLSLFGVFSDKSRAALMVREHCAGVAALCRQLAVAVAPKRTNDAFLAGLTHDLGKLLLIQSGEFSYDALPPAVVESPGKSRAFELEQLGFDHAVLGQLALSLWELPQQVSEAAGYHHGGETANELTGDTAQLAALVSVCDQLDYHIRFSPQYAAAVQEDLARSPHAHQLGLEPGHVEEMWVELVAARAEAAGLLA